MKIYAANRIAHTSSFAVSCMLNALILLLLVLFGNAGKKPTPQGTVIYASKKLPKEIITKVEPVSKPDVDNKNTEEPWKNEFPQSFQKEEPFLNEPLLPESSPVNWMTEPTPIHINLSEDLGSRGKEGRKEKLKNYAGGCGGMSELAVIRALNWLQAHQHTNGSWTKDGNCEGGGSNAGYTGLAVLTFLAHGETPASEAYGSTVARGIRFLVENQDASGVFQPAGSHTAYGHAIATYALAEAATMTGNPLMHEPLRRAVKVMVEGQMPNGGYDYEYKEQNRNDLSLGAWHVQALKAASLALPEDHGIKDAMQSAMDGMLSGSKNIAGQGRGFTYTVTGNQVGAPRRIISAAGSLGLQLTGRARSGEAREAIRYLKDITPKVPNWFLTDAESVAEHGGEIMFCYYAVQAFFYEDAHGENFTNFFPVMVQLLSTQQSDDGSWQGVTEKGKHQGRVFNTTLGAMGLMVPYRSHLPTAMDPKPVSTDKQEEVIEFQI